MLHKYPRLGKDILLTKWVIYTDYYYVKKFHSIGLVNSDLQIITHTHTKNVCGQAGSPVKIKSVCLYVVSEVCFRVTHATIDR